MLVERLAKRDRPVHLRAIGELTDRIDAATLFLDPPLADPVEVLEREPERIHHAVTARARRRPAVLFQPRAQ